MTDNTVKRPFAESLNRTAIRQAKQEIHNQGKALPCSVVAVDGAIVTVQFDVSSKWTIPNITIPVFGPEWVRYPIQKGDKGVTIAADVEIGGVTGLGVGTADLTQPANLTALYFMPVGNKNWPKQDPNKVTIYGKDGVVLMDNVDPSCVFTLTGDGIFITRPHGSTNTGQLNVQITDCDIHILNGSIFIQNGDVIADGVDLKHHVHENTQPGAGLSGPPLPQP